MAGSDITTYRINGRVYLVVDEDFAYVYDPDGAYLGAGEAFREFLNYSEGLES